MNMTNAERLILSNQYEILARLHPDQAAAYQRAGTIIRAGYVMQLVELESALGHLDLATCQEVIDTLEMYHALAVSWENLGLAETTEINPDQLLFKGYCRSQERQLADYVCFLLDVEKKFPELGRSCSDMNIEVTMRAKYQRMLASWRQCPRHYRLSIQEIRRILAA